MATDNQFSSNRGRRDPLTALPGGEAPESTAVVVRLPNAMVGREFSVAVERVDPVSELPSGLEFNDGVLRGIPEVAGEFEILFRCHSTIQESAVEERVMTLMINPDPRSLWKNLPSDREAEFWKPDAATGFLNEGPLTIVGASLRGRSHAHVGAFRDDDMAMAWFPAASWYSLTVADGAGSAKFSRQGSKIACDSVTAYFANYFATPENALSRLVAELKYDLTGVRGELYNQFGNAAIQARKAIEDQAAALDASTRDFHTTLITALVHPLADGRWFVAVFSIGDGAAALASKPACHPCLLTRPDGGEYAGQTVFLTMKEALATGEAIMGRIQIAVIPDFDALILVTDGISDPRFDSDSALADPVRWTALWDELNQVTTGTGSPGSAAAALLKWMEFHSPGHHDDRTLLLATPSRADFPP